MEVIHHPNYDKNVFMPFVPAIKIKSGKVLWLAGTIALPVYNTCQSAFKIARRITKMNRLKKCASNLKRTAQ